MPNTIRILTLNIWNYNAPWPTRRSLIIDTINQHNPDIIGFQEIRHSGEHNIDGKNQAQQFAKHLPGYTYIYRPAQQNPERDQWEGLSIFSRLPILSSSYLKLSQDPNDNRDNHQRIVLRTEVQTPAGPFNLFDTHLSLSQQGRSRTVKEITQYVSQYPNTTLAVLVGDFNETPDQEPILHIVKEGAFIDAWDNQHPNDKGWTYTTENTYVRNRNDDRKGHRIDYIFVRPNQNGQGTILNCQRIADQPDSDDHYPSDHFGLIADLSLEA